MAFTIGFGGSMGAACGSSRGVPSAGDASLADAAGNTLVTSDAHRDSPSEGGARDTGSLPPTKTPDGGPDAGVADARPEDAADGAAADAAPRDGGPLNIGDGGACGHELANPNCWSAFDTIAIHPNGSLYGGAFDGRYVYFVSSGSATTNDMIRFDTSSSFALASGWSAFNLSSVNTQTITFAGAGFDGRYVYFAPFEWTYSSVLSRYDTQAAFGSASAWSNFDLSTANGSSAPYAIGYVGAAFDGRYLYLVPNCIYEYWKGLVMRYDSSASFSAVGSWSTFDTLTLDANAGGYRGVAFDHRYLYFVPWGDMSSGTGQPKHLITRLDTQASFTATSSWSTFDTTAIVSTYGFAGAAFDGRYVYFTPADYRGQVTRFDTQATFSAAASWSTFDMSALSGSARNPYIGATFDGRYLYFVPSSSVVVSYDTQSTFAASASWSAFDLSSLDSRASGFAGGVFDGRYVYLVPTGSDLVFRFDAKTPPSVPTTNSASFL